MVFVYGQRRQQQRRCQGYNNSSQNIYVPANKKHTKTEDNDARRATTITKY